MTKLSNLRAVAETLLDRLGQINAERRIETTPSAQAANAGKTEASFDPLIEFAACEFAARRARNQEIGEEFFHEPAWDMLLLLYAKQGTLPALTSLNLIEQCCRSGSTGVRWLEILISSGLVMMEERHFLLDVPLIGLTPAGSIKVQKTLLTTVRHFLPTVEQLMVGALY